MATRSKVLIVDDSALMRQLLTQIIGSDPELEVVGTAGDPFVAREKIKALNPDVLTLDIEMPRMDGLTFLEKLMRGHPMPVVMISSLTSKGADTTFRALSLGAIDYVSKPKVDVSNGTVEQAEEIVAKVKAAAKANVRRASASKAPAAPLSERTYQFSATHKVVAIGASTGGTEALKELLVPLPADFPGIVIVQHMPEAFTRQFAERLDSLCRIRVKEAQDARPHSSRTRPAGARWASDGRDSQRNGICCSCIQGRTGESPSPVCGCYVFLVRPQHGEERARRITDRNGRGWRAGHARNEAGRRI